MMDTIIGAIAASIAFIIILWLQQAWIGKLKRDCERLEHELDKAKELADLAHEIAWAAAETGHPDCAGVPRKYIKRIAEIVNARAAIDKEDEE